VIPELLRAGGRSLSPVVPIPLRESERSGGFHLAELVARAAVKELATGVLVWQRATVFQVRLTRQRCIENMGDAFRVRDRQRMRGLTVIVEDDVMTTGTRLSECAAP